MRKRCLDQHLRPTAETVKSMKALLTGLIAGGVMVGSFACSQQHKQSTAANAAAQDAKQSTAHSSASALPENRDAEVQVGPTTMLVQGQLERSPASRHSSETAVVVECDKEWKENGKGKCLWIEAAIDENGNPHIGTLDFLVSVWTDEEVFAERAGIGDMCYNEVVLIKLAKPFRGEYPSNGATTLTKTPRALDTETRRACEWLHAMTPEVSRVDR